MIGERRRLALFWWVGVFWDDPQALRGGLLTPGESQEGDVHREESAVALRAVGVGVRVGGEHLYARRCSQHLPGPLLYPAAALGWGLTVGSSPCSHMSRWGHREGRSAHLLARLVRAADPGMSPGHCVGPRAMFCPRLVPFSLVTALPGGFCHPSFPAQKRGWSAHVSQPVSGAQTRVCLRLRTGTRLLQEAEHEVLKRLSAGQCFAPCK